MDPKANLKEQLEIAREIERTVDDCNADGTLTREQEQYNAEMGARLAELVLALDEWLRTGGFSPWKGVHKCQSKLVT